MDQQKIGGFLKELRLEKQMTQEQLAEQIGVSRRTVSRWETGNNLPDLSAFADKLEKACIDTIESGKITKDLALITELENPTVLNSLDFIKAIRANLEKML